MEPKFQSSFIPKGPVAQSGAPTRLSRSSERSLLGTLAVFVFSFSMLMSLGVYGYQLFLGSSIRGMESDLAAARQSLQPDTIKKISNLDGRIVSTKTLLQNHIVLTPLFAYLEGATVQQVRFTDFTYTTTDKGITLEMKGLARGYSAIAQESQILNADGSPLKHAVFSNLNLDDKGDVAFSFSALVDPSLISYVKEVGAVPAVVPVTPINLIPVQATSTNSTSTSSTTNP